MRLFDLHCDTVYECYQKKESLKDNTCAVDLVRGARYQPWFQVFAVWIPDAVRGERAWQQCCDMLSYAREQVTDGFCFADTYSDFLQAFANGKTVGLLGVEGGAALAGKTERVAELAALGVKVITITWNGSNELGNGCMARDSSGLTAMGKTAVHEMERHGIVPDVSHLNEAGFWDVALTTRYPFIASHSVCMTVNEHPRNLCDEQLGLLRDRGGLAGLTVCKEQVGAQTFDGIYRHLNRYWELGCEDNVALGFDLDGTDIPPEWRGIAVYERFWEYLKKRGIDDETTDKVFFRNAYRFFSDVLQR